MELGDRIFEAEVGAGVQALTDWMVSPQGNLCVCPLTLKLQGALKTPSSSVLLSPHTLAKQLNKHPELSPHEYHAVFIALASGETYLDGAFRVVIIYELDRWYKVVLKATAARDEVFLVSLFRMDEKTLKKVRRLPQI